jgi:hypothetical protein
MKGLKYFFPGIPTVWMIFMAMILIGISCHSGCQCRGCGGCQGCTTSVVVESESQKIKVDDIRMRLTANKNRITNRKLRYNQTFYVDKTVWYSVDYMLELRKRPAIRNLCEYEVDSQEDLEKALKKFQIRFSPNKQHFAVGLDNHVYEFFHLLDQGVPFSSGCYYLNDSSFAFLQAANLNFDQINWQVFPKSDDLFSKLLIHENYSQWAVPNNRDNVLKLLSMLPPGNKNDLLLVENWYNEMANQHFNQNRVEQIAKVSPEWINIASKSLIKELEKNHLPNETVLGSTLDIAIWINDARLFGKMDTMVYKRYQASGLAGNYLVSRWGNKKNPLEKQLSNQLLEKSIQTATSQKERGQEFPIEWAVDILLIAQNYDALKQFLDNDIETETLFTDFATIWASSIQKYDKFPKELQEKMVDKYRAVVIGPCTEFSFYEMGQMLEFLKNKLPCSELKKLVNQHREKLIGFVMPDGCKE